MEPTLGFEPKTSSLPRKCSAAELCGPGGHDRIKGWWAGRESNPHSRRRLIYSQRSSPPAQPTHGLRLPSETRRLVVKRMTCAASSSIWSRRRDSNPEPAVYKTAALPIELRRRRRGRIPHPRGSVQRRPMDLVRRRSTAVPSVAGFGGPGRTDADGRDVAEQCVTALRDHRTARDLPARSRASPGAGRYGSSAPRANV